MGFVIRYPSHFEQDQRLIEAKGWLEGVVIEAGGLEYHPVFCDEPRLAQEIRDALAADQSLALRSVVVLPSVTRDHIAAAVEHLSRSGFSEIA